MLIDSHVNLHAPAFADDQAKVIDRARAAGVGLMLTICDKVSSFEAVHAIAINPECGEPLKRELDGLRKYRVRRLRIVYAVHQKTRVIRLMAVGHRRSVYEELIERIRRKTQE